MGREGQLWLTLRTPEPFSPHEPSLSPAGLGDLQTNGVLHITWTSGGMQMAHFLYFRLAAAGPGSAE